MEFNFFGLVIYFKTLWKFSWGATAYSRINIYELGVMYLISNLMLIKK